MRASTSGPEIARRASLGRRPSGGGVPARRAVVRWAWRLFRREWRQQALVIALLTLAVALAVGGASTAYNSARPVEDDFGTADHRLVSALPEGTDQQKVDAYLTAAEEWFGPIDVISQRHVPIPGSTETVELRAQDPEGPYGGPTLALREGRYPRGADETAVTEGVAETFQVTTGDTLALDGEEWTVVGLVENPTYLDDEFAVVPPSMGSRMTSLNVLVKGTEEQVRSFPPDFDLGSGYVQSRRSTSDRTAAGGGALAASTVVLLLVCLIGAASFVVVAQRRLRQIGMLAAIGASPKHLRLVVVANGAVVGAIAAVLGSVIGLAVWVAIAPRMETVVGHRIDRFDVPWMLIGLGMLLAVGAASLAAWWPARTMARVPVTRALSGRPPRPRPARRSLVLAVPLLGLGVLALAAGNDVVKDEGNGLLMIAGAVAIPLGIVFACPAAIRVLTPVARWLPVAPRLALRDLARYRARSGAALAAISVGLGIAVAVVVMATAIKYGAGEGNLSDQQLLFRVDEENEVGTPVDVPAKTPAEIEAFESAVAGVAERLDDTTIVPLDVAVDPAAKEPRDGEVLQPPVSLGREVSETTYRDTGPIYVATPQVLEHAGLDQGSPALDADVLIDQELFSDIGGADPDAIQEGALAFVGTSRKNLPIRDVEAIDVSPYWSAPRSFVTPEAIRRNGWETAPAAWFVEAKEPLTGQQLAEAREMAADEGMTVEVRRAQEGLGQMRAGATVVAVLLGLGTLAMTVGLIRSEATGDLRTLAATGASGRVRRTITGVTAGTLAFLGALLGTAGAYAGLAAGYDDDIAQLSQPPVPELVVIAVGLPLLAAAAGWLLAGREPPALARTPIE